jgi:hypothetical protein
MIRAQDRNIQLICELVRVCVRACVRARALNDIGKPLTCLHVTLRVLAMDFFAAVSNLIMVLVDRK